MATSNVNNIFQVGGGVNNTSGLPQTIIPISDFSKIKNLTSRADTASRYNAMYSHMSPATGAIYQVPTGKTWVCTGFTLINDGSLLVRFSFGYGTASFTDGQAGAPTGNVVYGSSNPFIISASYGGVFFPVNITFPALSFPYWFTDQGAAVQRMLMQGIEI